MPLIGQKGIFLHLRYLHLPPAHVYFLPVQVTQVYSVSGMPFREENYISQHFCKQFCCFVHFGLTVPPDVATSHGGELPVAMF